MESYNSQRPIQYSKQVLTAAKRKRHEEEKQMVREFVLGKGRSQPNTSQNEGQKMEREQSNDEDTLVDTEC